MRKISLVVGAVGLIGFVACGGDSKPPVASDGTAGKSSGGKNSGGDSPGGEGGAPDIGGKFGRAGSAGKGGKASVGDGGDAGGGGEGGAIGSGTPPTVTILSPVPVTNPLGGQVLVADSVDVVCKVQQGVGDDASPVDPQSVKITVLDSGGAPVSEKAAGLVGNDEYTATVPLTLTTSGKVTLRCSAETTADAIGTSDVDTLVDRGPKVTLVSPAPDTKIALKDKVTVSFTALPQPLADGDVQADVASVELRVNGVHVDSSPVNGMPGSYTAEVDFASAAFQTKPNGDTSFGITATNKRAPDAAIGSITPKVVVDGNGPLINVTTPSINKLVGGFVEVKFALTDALSGANPDSIVVTLNEETREFDPNSADWTVDGNNYTYKFDSRSVLNAKVQINVTVSAEDKVGNATSSATIPTYLDNVKPLVDLDPRTVRTRATPPGCSAPLDPVGNNALSDYDFSALKVSTGYDFVRVLVWDKTNQIVGSPAPLHFAGTNPNSVRVYFQNPGSVPALLKNSKTPGTGTCDEIGDTTNSISMTALLATGSPYYNGDSTSVPLDASCTYPVSGNLPPFLCLNEKSDLRQVIGHNEGDLAEPAVYARTPSAGTQECTGSAWDVTSLIAADRQDGFVCFAARAVDKVGNVGVSPPIRVCVDTDITDNVKPACATQSIQPPSCTDGCTPPARGGGTVSTL